MLEFDHPPSEFTLGDAFANCMKILMGIRTGTGTRKFRNIEREGEQLDTR
jgi:hypothetical protein